MHPEFVSMGFRAVQRSKRDGLVWIGSKIVRDRAEAERVVARWSADHPARDEDPLCFEVQEVFARPFGVPGTPFPEPKNGTEVILNLGAAVLAARGVDSVDGGQQR